VRERKRNSRCALTDLPRMHRLACAALLVLGCQAPLPEAPERTYGADAAAPASLEVEPGEPAAAPSVLRIRVRFDATLSVESTLHVYAGELSRYHLGRIVAGDLPGTLLDRIVPALGWTERDGELAMTTLAPSVPLAEGTYSVACQALGLIGIVRVTSPSVPLAARVWPPSDTGVGAAHVVFCGERELDAPNVEVMLEPGALPATLRRGLGERASMADRCSELETTGSIEQAAVVPPASAGGVALDPAPLVSAPAADVPPVGCLSEEVQFAQGCAIVLDDRAIVRSAEAPLLWLVEAPLGAQLDAVAAGARFVLRGLTPGRQNSLDAWTYDLAGRRSGAHGDFAAREPLAHVVINEVLANAAGAEPAQEWIELFNDGQIAIELDGATIEDAGGVTMLGAHVLEPGAFALVVGEDYDAASDLDVAPAPGTPLLRVIRVGENGLSNSGERLVLRDASGTELSRFPALTSTPGRSIARRQPYSLDDDANSFAEHAPPGASPGAPNAF
jgi:hypothetical protein